MYRVHLPCVPGQDSLGGRIRCAGQPQFAGDIVPSARTHHTQRDVGADHGLQRQVDQAVPADGDEHVGALRDELVDEPGTVPG